MNRPPRRSVPTPRHHVVVRKRLVQGREDLVVVAMQLFGALVHEARRSIGLSKAGLGARCGLHQSTISRLENGRLTGLAFHRMAMLVFVLREPLRLDQTFERFGIEARIRLRASGTEVSFEPRGVAGRRTSA
jgi:transcriptional regulator with XRE-family HTH domain